MPDLLDQRIKILSEIKDPFGRVPNIIIDLYGPGMGQAGWLYTLLTRFKNNDSSETFVSLKTLAITGGVTEKTIKSWAEHLELLGVIRITRDETYMQEKRRAAPNNYVLLLPPFPPPDEIVKAHFPAGWEPPERALKAIKNVSNYLVSDSTPQETWEQEGVGEKITPTPDVQGTTEGGVGEIVTPSRDKESPYKGKNLPPNKTLLTSSSLQETTTNDVVELMEIFETCRQFSPKVTQEDLNRWWKKALDRTNDKLKAIKFLEEQLQVAGEQRNNLGDFIPWYNSAVEKGYHTRAFYEKERLEREQRLRAKKIADKQREREDAEKQYQIDFEKRKAASVDDIVNYYKIMPVILKEEQKLRMLKSRFEGVNPNLEEALKRIPKGGG